MPECISWPAPERFACCAEGRTQFRFEFASAAEDGEVAGTGEEAEMTWAATAGARQTDEAVAGRC
jgi:hypothetical protein